MRIAVLGSGGREHALALALQKDGAEVVGIPGNGGFEPPLKRKRVPLTKEGVSFLKEEKVDLVVVGPEAPLVEGIGDLLRENGIFVFGPSSKGAILESSKGFAKEFMRTYGIPTSPFTIYNDIEKAKKDLKNRLFPVVIKADGLCGGKGVKVCREYTTAENYLVDLMERKIFGKSGEKVVIEDFLPGIELSAHVLLDESGYYLLPFTQDHKTLFAGGAGPNTGGMGAYGPPSFVDPSLKKKIEETIVEKVWEGIQKEKIPYRGVLYLGLMVVDGEPSVLEFNVRFGDPECQVLMALLEDELLPYLFSTARGELSTLPPPPPPKQYALSVVFVALGYPSTYRKGIEFTLPTPPPSFTWIHAGTEKKGDRWVSTGGRVVNLVGSSPSFPSLWETMYDFVKNHPIPGLFFREDIGFSELSYHTSL